MWTQSCFKSGFWNAFWNAKKSGVLDRDPPRKPDSRTCERKALSEHDSCGLRSRNKISLAVRRSWSWLGRRLQCMWTHVVQITIPITFWIVIRNVFRNVILAHVNTAMVPRPCLISFRYAISLNVDWVGTKDKCTIWLFERSPRTCL